MTKRRNALALILIIAALAFAQSPSANAFDLTGAWASDSENCSKVFKRDSKGLSFAKDSEVYGSGFIIERDRIVGRYARCKIKARKDNGSTTNLIANCASDIMLSSVQLSAKEIDANTFARLFPGMDDMQIKYYRCPVR